MANYSGSALYLEWIQTTGTTVFSGDFRNFTVSETADEIDATAGADSRRVYLGGPMDGEANLEYVDQAGGSAAYSAVVPQATGTLRWSPEGTASGKIKYSQEAVVLSRERAQPYDDVPVITIGWRLSAAQSQAVY